MESTPRTLSLIVNDLEQRLKNLHTTGVHDEQTLNNLEHLINECSSQLNRLTTTSDSTCVAILCPALLQIIISLTKICTDKSDVIISSTSLSREKLTPIITRTKTLYNQIKECIKSPKLLNMLTESSHLRHFCEQVHVITDSIANIDMVTTAICHKVLVRVITGNDDQQQSQQQVSIQKNADISNDLIMAIYRSMLKQFARVCAKDNQNKPDTTKESPYMKIYVLYVQAINRLLQINGIITEIESYSDFHNALIQLHICLESTCQQNHFQFQHTFFNNTILLQNILQLLISNCLITPSKFFFDEFFQELLSNPNHYTSLIVLFRIIEAFDQCLTKHQTDDNLSIHIIHLLISHVFYLIDQCRIQLGLSAILPLSFDKIPVAYGSLYDITYSLLMRLFNHQPMQTILSCMTKLLENSEENSLLLPASNQLSSELILQSWYLYNQSIEFQYLYSLFLAQLIQYNKHSSLINHFLTMPNIRSIKYRTYDILISSNIYQRIQDLFFILIENQTKESLINSTNLSFIYPTNLNHLYAFVRLFNTELNTTQIQHTIDTCIYSIQQFLSLPIITESSSKTFLLTLRILRYLTVSNNNENFKCLLGQLTQILVILDEQTALDIRLELLHMFAVHSNLLDDNDLGRLLDFMLTNSIESNSNSIAFHLGCLNVVDSLKQRPSRSVNITDLIIQLIVRYGNEHQCSHLLKAQLMRVFMGYVINGNDDSLPMRIKSQCILLRSSIDEFEKSKKSTGTPNDRFSDEKIIKILDSIQPTIKKDFLINEYDEQLKFYQTIVDELEFHRCSITTQNPNEMQQD